MCILKPLAGRWVCLYAMYRPQQQQHSSKQWAVDLGGGGGGVMTGGFLIQ